MSNRYFMLIVCAQWHSMKKTTFSTNLFFKPFEEWSSSTNIMEATIRKITIFYFFAPFPFEIKFKPGLQSNLIPKKLSPSHLIWIFSCFLHFVNFPIVIFSLILRTPKYFSNRQYDKLAFHGTWTAFAGLFVNQELPYLFVYAQKKYVMLQTIKKQLNER